MGEKCVCLHLTAKISIYYVHTRRSYTCFYAVHVGIPTRCCISFFLYRICQCDLNIMNICSWDGQFKVLVQCNLPTDVHASLTSVLIDLPKLTATFLRHTFFTNNYVGSLQNLWYFKGLLRGGWTGLADPATARLSPNYPTPFTLICMLSTRNLDCADGSH